MTCPLSGVVPFSSLLLLSSEVVDTFEHVMAIVVQGLSPHHLLFVVLEGGGGVLMFTLW